MIDNDLKRISRLTAIMLLLQTRKLSTAAALARRFSVSVRTIYRDIRTLEQAGMPIITEDGKGFSLMDGYRIPPVMFTESEANALVTAEQLVKKSKDRSLSEEYIAAINKIKAVLKQEAKEKAELLSSRIATSPMNRKGNQSSALSQVQQALTSYRILKIVYQSAHTESTTERHIEPFALYYSEEENWLLIAWCRLRKDYRMFRLDRILKTTVESGVFKPHKLSLTDFLEEKKKNFLHP